MEEFISYFVDPGLNVKYAFLDLGATNFQIGYILFDQEWEHFMVCLFVKKWMAQKFQG